MMLITNLAFFAPLIFLFPDMSNSLFLWFVVDTHEPPPPPSLSLSLSLFRAFFEFPNFDYMPMRLWPAPSIPPDFFGFVVVLLVQGPLGY